MKTTTFLTFVGDQCGKAEEAINFYTTVFPNSKILSITKYAEGQVGGTPDLVKLGVFTINGTEYLLSENNYKHAWSFSPGVSMYIESNSESEIDNLFEQLSSNGGKVMVPLADYSAPNFGFGKKFGWCEDKYGVSWQINLAE